MKIVMTMKKTGINMDKFKNVLPLLYEILNKKRRVSININFEDKAMIIRIWTGLYWRKFQDYKPERLANLLKTTYKLF